jgi:hypothetical protein
MPAIAPLLRLELLSLPLPLPLAAVVVAACWPVVGLLCCRADVWDVVTRAPLAELEAAARDERVEVADMSRIPYMNRACIVVGYTIVMDTATSLEVCSGAPGAAKSGSRVFHVNPCVR